MPSLTNLSDHPLVADRLARLRSVDCPPPLFRQLVADLARLLVLPTSQNFASQPTTITTPITTTSGRLLQRPIILVPILRAGLALCDHFLQLLPEASVAHYGVSRNEDTLQPEIYFAKFPPNLPDAEVIVLDPMLATGGSAVAALSELKKRGAQHLHFVCLVAAPEGIQLLQKHHPDVPLTTATIDQKLNSQGFIVPGLGDAGDRIFGT